MAHGYPWPAHFEPATMSCTSSVGEGTAAHPGLEAASAPQPSAAKPGREIFRDDGVPWAQVAGDIPRFPKRPT